MGCLGLLPGGGGGGGRALGAAPACGILPRWALGAPLRPLPRQGFDYLFEDLVRGILVVVSSMLLVMRMVLVGASDCCWS
jgi:hypothetical protein